MIRQITLWDIMKRFDSSLFFEFGALLGTSDAIEELYQRKPGAASKRGVMSASMKQNLVGYLQALQPQCERLELKTSASYIRDFLWKLSNTEMQQVDVGKGLHALREMVTHEMRSMIFLCIEPKQGRLLTNEGLFGKEVTVAFPSAIIDIEEAGKCLAFERWTACAFHLMRVMELGLRTLGDAVHLSATTNRTWDAVLKKCDDEAKKPFKERSPEWQSDEEFFAGAAAMLRSVKDAWRNPTMHVEKVYTAEQVEDVWNAVKGFMRHLATKLPEPTVS